MHRLMFENLTKTFILGIHQVVWSGWCRVLAVDNDAVASFLIKIHISVKAFLVYYTFLWLHWFNSHNTKFKVTAVTFVRLNIVFCEIRDILEL